MSTSTPIDPSTAAVILGVVSNALWAAIDFGGRSVLRRLNSHDPRLRRNVLLGVLFLILGVLALALLALWMIGAGAGWAWLLLVCAILWSLYIVLRELNRFWGIGLLGADAEIGGGLSYEAALRLVTKQLSFLGTGAYKLSRTEEFARALHSCLSDDPIRLLLRRPTDPTLAAAASRARKPENEYHDNVIESLRRIARLKKELPNLHVRFYEGERYFRVMLIDQRVALISLNDYGRGDGSQLPQLHFIDVSQRPPGKASFFQMFEKYFNDNWDAAAPDEWDFQRYL